MTSAPLPASARVVQSFGDHGWAVAEPVKECDESQPVRIQYQRKLGRCLAGDRVELGSQNEVKRILQRRNRFGRGTKSGQYQAIAANLDSLIIVIAPRPAPSISLLHRYLTAARIERIEPVIVVNKMDLEWPDQAPFNQLDQLGVPVHRVQCEPVPDMDVLPPVLNHGVHLLAGQSGVGKSSISNALLPDLDLQTQALSDATGKGRHTTSAATLYSLSKGGWLVDTPGVWEYGLWTMPAKTLERGFPEFEPYSTQCRFRDCSHQHEPGCAVLDAVERGEIKPFRYQAWLGLLAEQARLGR